MTLNETKYDTLQEEIIQLEANLCTTLSNLKKTSHPLNPGDGDDKLGYIFSAALGSSYQRMRVESHSETETVFGGVFEARLRRLRRFVL